MIPTQTPIIAHPSRSAHNPEVMGSFDFRKRWLLGGYSSVFESSTPLSVQGLCDLVDGCMRTLLPALTPLPSASEIVDFKGRNPLDVMIAGLPQARQDELFRVGGMCAVEEAQDGFVWDSFDLCCYSPFSRFQGTHHIVHALEFVRSGALPLWLPPRLVGSAAPIEIRYFRFGLEHFRSVRTFASLGYTPQVAESLLIDYNSNTLGLRLSIESNTRKIEDPFETVPAFRCASEVVRQASGFNLQDEYMMRLKQNW